MRRWWSGIMVAAIVCLGAVAWAQQGQPRPGPGSGVVTVEGTVSVGNAVAARQDGDWKMAIANTPSVNVANSPAVSVAPLPFLKVGQRYEVIWSTGETDRVLASAVGPGAWMRVGGDRWINLAQARSVTTLR